MPDPDRLDIRRLAVTCLVSAEHPSPEAVGRRLDDLLAGIGEELGGAMAPWVGGEGIWLLRRIELDLTLDLDAPAEEAGRRWARGLAKAIAGRLDRAADGVVFFADRTAHLARFLADLAAGDAWSLWYHGGFSGLKALPLPMALRTAVLADPARGLRALSGLGTADLGRVLDALGSAEAARILDALPVVPDDEPLPALVGQLETLGWPPVSSSCPERLALALTIRLATPGSAACARAVASLRSLQAQGGDPSEALSAGGMAALTRTLGSREVERLLPLLRAPAALRERLARTLAPTAPQPDAAALYTPFGGPFVLLRLLDDLPLDGLASWPEAEGASAATVMRALVLAAATGREHALAFLLDPVWRSLLGLPPSLLPATLARWGAVVDRPMRQRWRRLLTGVPRGGGRALPPSLCPDPALDRLIGAACRWLLARLADRLPGFGGSSPAYLRSNFLALQARLEPAGEALRVTLSRPSLDVVLAMTGLARGRLDLPWLTPSRLELCREG